MTHQTAGYAQEDGKRDQEAFVECTQDQVDHQKTDTEDDGRRTALLILFAGDASVIVSITFGQGSGSCLLNGTDGVTRTVTIGRHGIYGNRVVHIETAQ